MNLFKKIIGSKAPVADPDSNFEEDCKAMARGEDEAQGRARAAARLGRVAGGEGLCAGLREHHRGEHPLQAHRQHQRQHHRHEERCGKEQPGDGDAAGDFFRHFGSGHVAPFVQSGFSVGVQRSHEG